MRVTPEASPGRSGPASIIRGMRTLSATGPCRRPAGALPGSPVRASHAVWPLLVALAGCGPGTDWRSLQPPDWGLQAVMPCRPDRVARRVALGPASVDLTLYSCEAAGHTFGLSSGLLPDPAQVNPALGAMAASLRDNLRAAPLPARPAAVPGMTPAPASGHWRWEARRPDGTPVVAEVRVFSHGLRVYQATVLGPSAEAALTAPFFDALQVRP